jgi:hypothetical protein
MAGVEEAIITGRSFSFEIDGKEIPVASVEPGEFTTELKDATMGNRTSNEKGFTVTKPSFSVRDAHVPDIAKDKGAGLSKTPPAQFGSWRVEVIDEESRLHLKTMFQAFSTGVRKMNPSDTGSLVYKDRNDQEARRINFFGFVPTHYESISLDSRNPGQAAVEVMEFAVARCEYA